MFQGVVQSVEDYGYIVNIGVNGVRAFLNKTEKVLKECDIVLVAVKSANDSNIILGKFLVWYLHNFSVKPFVSFL